MNEGKEVPGGGPARGLGSTLRSLLRPVGYGPSFRWRKTPAAASTQSELGPEPTLWLKRLWKWRQKFSELDSE